MLETTSPASLPRIIITDDHAIVAEGYDQLAPLIGLSTRRMRQLDFSCALTRPVNEPVPIFPGNLS
jgi:hypothetical protein